MQQKIRTAIEPIHATVTIPGSKTISQRAILLAALSDGVSEISGLRIDKDTRVFINALYQLGIIAQLDEKSFSCIIAGGNGRFPKKQATVWCADCATITRYLMAACAATPGIFYFDGSIKLRKKSIAALLNVLRLQGVQFIPSDVIKLPFTLLGSDTLEGGEVTLEDTALNQILSALLIISPYARTSFNFLVPNLIRQSDIDITCTMMAEFGVLVHRIHQGQFMIPVPQRYQATDYLVEPDISLAVYFLAAAAITGGEITIQSIKRIHAKQGAIKFLSVLEKMGCEIRENQLGITLKGPEKLKGVEVSMREFANTFFVLTALAPFAQTPTRIIDLKNVHPKTFARLNAMKKELLKMGVRVETEADAIEILPSTPKSGLFQSHHDYRIGMALALIGLKTPDLVIENAEFVSHFFPAFFNLWEQMAVETNTYP